MIDDLNSKVLYFESFISNLEDKLSSAKFLLRKFEHFEENSVEESKILEEFEASLDENNNSTIFLEEKIKFSTMLKTFKKDDYNYYLESFISKNKVYCRDDSGDFYLCSEIISLIEEIDDMIEE